MEKQTHSMEARNWLVLTLVATGQSWIFAMSSKILPLIFYSHWQISWFILAVSLYSRIGSNSSAGNYPHYAADQQSIRWIIFDTMRSNSRVVARVDSKKKFCCIFDIRGRRLRRHSQVKRECPAWAGLSIRDLVVTTIDIVQDQEYDLTIHILTRAGPEVKDVTFRRNDIRLNVMASRSRYGTVLISNSSKSRSGCKEGQGIFAAYNAVVRWISTEKTCEDHWWKARITSMIMLWQLIYR